MVLEIQRGWWNIMGRLLCVHWGEFHQWRSVGSMFRQVTILATLWFKVFIDLRFPWHVPWTKCAHCVAELDMSDNPGALVKYVIAGELMFIPFIRPGQVSLWLHKNYDSYGMYIYIYLHENLEIERVQAQLIPLWQRGMALWSSPEIPVGKIGHLGS